MEKMSKTPEEIKIGLECAVDKKCIMQECPYYSEEYNCIRTAQVDALALIQQLERDKNWVSENYDLIHEENKRLEAQVPKWISVEERLPEDDVDVLVYAIGNNESSCVAMTSYTHHMYGYDIEGWRPPWEYFFYERDITHWMPLPEPPKEDNNA